MDIFIGFIELISIFGIWYFWKKRPNKKGLIVSAILLFVFGGLYSTTNTYKADQKSQEASSSSMEASSIKESKRNSSLIVASSKKKEADKKVKSSITASSKVETSKTSNKTSSKELLSNSDVKKVIHKSNPNLKVTSVNGMYDSKEEKTVAIELKGQDAVTNKLTTEGFLMDIRSVWFAFKESGDAENFDNVNVSVKFPFRDEAGNSSNVYVVKTNISGFKLSNINVKHFLFKNVPTYADSYWQHTALPEIN